MQRIMRYFKGIFKFGLIYKKRSEVFIFICFCDADWVSDSDIRKFISVNCLLFGFNEYDLTVIFWYSKKQ